MRPGTMAVRSYRTRRMAVDWHADDGSPERSWWRQMLTHGGGDARTVVPQGAAGRRASLCERCGAVVAHPTA